MACLLESDPLLRWLACGLGWCLLALAWIDYETFRLPDALTLPLLVAGLGAAAWRDTGLVTDHALAAMLAYCSIRAIAAFYRWYRGFDGLGQGDAKLLAAAGAWVGASGIALGSLHRRIGNASLRGVP